jgi:hypothetical protein
MGYAGHSSMIAIEFDSWANPGTASNCGSDPLGDHIGVLTPTWAGSYYTGTLTARHILPNSYVMAPFDQPESGVYDARIIYVAPYKREAYPGQLLENCPLPSGYSLNENLGLLCVYLNGVLKLQYPLGDIHSLSADGRLYVGFSSSTGSNSQNHDILSWSLTSIGHWRDTIGVYRPSQGLFLLRNTNTTGPADTSFYFGNPSASNRPISGDWDGDNLDSIGLYDTATGLFLLRNTNTTGPADIAFPFGNPGDLPLAGRWSPSAYHDGIGTYRNNGVIYLKNALSTGDPNFILILGQPDAIPISGYWGLGSEDGVGFYRPNILSPSDEAEVTGSNYRLVHLVSGYSIYTSFGKSGLTNSFAGRFANNYYDGLGQFDAGEVKIRFNTSVSNAEQTFYFGDQGDYPIIGRWQDTVSNTGTWYVSCAAPTTGVKVRNYPTFSGQEIGFAKRATLLTVYEWRWDTANPPEQWGRVTPYNGHNGQTLWIRKSFSGTSYLVKEDPSSTCGPIIPTLTIPTPLPTSTFTYPTYVAGCSSGSFCPHATPNAPVSDADLLAFIIACESDINPGVGNDYAPALNVASTILNRRMSGQFRQASVANVVRNPQFQCYAEGARAVSNFGERRDIPPPIRTIAANLVASTPNVVGLPTQAAWVRYESLYFFGNGAFSSSITTPTIVATTIIRYCDKRTPPPPVSYATRVFVGLDSLPTPWSYTNLYFSDDPSCALP